MVWITTEGIFLGISSSEDDISPSIENKDGYSSPQRKIYWVVNKVSCLQRVGKRYPGKVTKRKHEAETIVDDIHGGEESFFSPERIKNVPKLKEADKDHRISDIAICFILLSKHAVVNQHPTYKPWSHLTKNFPVKYTNSGVQLTTNEPVVDDIS